MSDPHIHDHDDDHGDFDTPMSSDPQRSASMRLRDPGQRAEHLMDPANQSLADALRITYRIVQLAMVVLAFLFIFSGVQRIGEGERGIPLLFGRPTASQLDPGLHLSAPFPIGEIVKVDATSSRLDINRTYWPGVRAGQEDQAIDLLPSSMQLTPGRDGSLVTGDLGIAHAQWRVEYRRTDQRTFAENIFPEAEKAIVTGAVQRAIVRVVAETPIDSLLKPGDSAEGSIAQRVREISQRLLSDELNSGIVIDKVSLYRKTAPVRLIPDFSRVQSALNQAKNEQEKAGGDKQAQLNAVAGQAAQPLIDLIQRYESAIELGQSERAEQILTAITDVFEGREVHFEDVVVPQGLASGEVTEIISQARSTATELRESAEADLRIFNAKLAQFEANPTLMMQRDWVSAYRELTGKNFVQTMLLPNGLPGQIIINSDPDIMRELYRTAKQREAEENQANRIREIERQRFETQKERPDIDQ